MGLANLISAVAGDDLPVAFEAYDGSRIGPPDPTTTVIVRSPDALSRILTRPGELGLSRAYVAGDIDVEGDIFALLALRDRVRNVRVSPAEWWDLARQVGPASVHRLPPPPEEARQRGRRHSRARDASSITHHYDVSNDFYRLVLGPSLTYSCAVFANPADSLEDAQVNKYELISRKLGLEPGMRLLDVGCGWGGMLLHAASHHGVRGVGVTISPAQAQMACRRVAEAGLADRVEIRLQDYRDIDDGPFDAISSIGMFEHVGRSKLAVYVERLFDLMRPGGRLLNHAIGRPGYPQPRTAHGRAMALARRVSTAAGARWPSRIDSAFMERYVFPDGELHELGTVVSMLHESGFEVRHVEGLREHYALTLRRWIANLERRWDDAVAEVGGGRARVWRLYMAASALGFEGGDLQLHQVLAVRPDVGRSGLPLRPTFEAVPLARTNGSGLVGVSR